MLRTTDKMATTSNMFMYSLTVQPPTNVSQALLGQFSGTKEQQIITASGSRLTLLQPDPRQGKVETVVTHDIFGIIRAISSFRLAGSHKGKLPLIPSREALSDSKIAASLAAYQTAAHPRGGLWLIFGLPHAEIMLTTTSSPRLYHLGD